MIWDDTKLLLKLYYQPRAAVSGIMDEGNWLYGAVAVLAISFVFQFAVTSRIHAVYGTREFDFSSYEEMSVAQQMGAGIGTPGEIASGEEFSEAEYEAAYEAWRKAEEERPRLPLVGDYGLKLFSFEPASFFTVLISLAVLYVPATILLLVMFEPLGSFGLILRRDYGTLLACTLMAWAAAHLPFALVGLALMNHNVGANFMLGLWLASSIAFGLLMVFVLRTVFGASYGKSVLTVSCSWLSLSMGARLFTYVSPYLFSPFLLFYAYMYFRGELGTIGNSYRHRQNFRRFLENATLNPHDAEAHYQLGLVYLQRRQDKEAAEHFKRAVEIDPREPDARFQLGRIARERGNLQEAIDHFNVVVTENERHANHEIWREIGATYSAAGMFADARAALEKFVERRPFDPEGLYYLGHSLQQLGEAGLAREEFEHCIEAVKTMPHYRRNQLRKWSKLSESQMSAAQTRGAATAPAS
ncbi:MAG TPA: tetratricopeptide repeat protein [Pyrinomonadaceae bacterium]|jgi:Flp pilus assembly protein TadD|nr:tetratricopeptide repeat protein [Pyrinomonadaceae bacterium]